MLRCCDTSGLKNGTWKASVQYLLGCISNHCNQFICYDDCYFLNVFPYSIITTFNRRNHNGNVLTSLRYFFTIYFESLTSLKSPHKVFISTLFLFCTDRPPRYFHPLVTRNKQLKRCALITRLYRVFQISSAPSPGQTAVFWVKRAIAHSNITNLKLIWGISRF